MAARETPDLNRLLSEWRRHATERGVTDESTLDELESHLLEEVDRLMGKWSDMTERQAFFEAAARLGHEDLLAAEYRKVEGKQPNRRNVVVEELSWRLGMLWNYVKIAFRNIGKSKATSLANITGLSVSIGVCILVFLFVDLQNSLDQVHSQGERIFLVEHVRDRDGIRQVWASSPMPMGPAIAADVPQVEKVVRVDWGAGTVRYGENVFDESFWFADSGFFQMFDFSLALGDGKALKDDNVVVLSHNAAVKYFGTEDPVGKPLTIRFSRERTETFTVSAVAAPFPANVSFRFNMLLPFEKLRDLGGPVDHWNRKTFATFVQIKESTDVAAVQAQLARYLPQQREANPEWPATEFRLVNLYDLARHGFGTYDLIAEPTHPVAMVILPVIAVFLLGLSCFNYMNVTLASASRRLKEIGMRKVMGCQRGQLVVQFIGENVILCGAALILGAALAYFVLIPQWNGLFEGWAPVEFSLTANPAAGLFLLVLLALTAVISGAYPAFYVSSFSPVGILKGTRHLGRNNLLSRTLLAFQFVLAFITMVAGIVMANNARYQASLDWGYDQEQVLAVPLRAETPYVVLADVLKQHRDVIALAPAQHHISNRRGYNAVEVNGKKMDAERFNVGSGYFETMGLRLREGRFFDQTRPGDLADAAIINETFARQQGWTNPVGQHFRVDSLSLTVVGMVADFQNDGFFVPILPTFFRLAKPDEYEFLVARLDARSAGKTVREIEAAWKSLFPDVPYYGYFQDTVFDALYTVNRNILKIFGFAAVMALMLSCLGLYGLASQNVSRRMKEVGVRKAFGASTGRIMMQVNGSFGVILLIAAFVGSAVAFFALNRLLDALYRIHSGVTPLPFFVTYLLVLGTAAIAIGTQVRRISRANPAEVLKDE